MSSSTPPAQVEADDAKQPVEQPLGSQQASIMASEEAAVSEEKALQEAPKPVVEYPKGLEVLFIMLALILSITLCSLDQAA
ncbi:hypothetical protein NLG97_g10277 [Lecanicillium saksenae]|uniref:Uncharacterized protein n=1 Tax=Lecanicillium saksenae TaxID=468837 RepID=A0ACC1QDN0_9HYPO|nr:hypothetical protein NLG97_g10277 [Lecanicillium saksenae]